MGKTAMPIIVVQATAGTFADKHQLAEDPAATLRIVGGVLDILMFRPTPAGSVHDLPEGGLCNVDYGPNHIRLQVLTNAGALDRGKQLAGVSQFTELVAKTAGDPTLTECTWVLLTVCSLILRSSVGDRSAAR